MDGQPPNVDPHPPLESLNPDKLRLVAPYGVASPIEKLPPEVLSDIFRLDARADDIEKEDAFGIGGDDGLYLEYARNGHRRVYPPPFGKPRRRKPVRRMPAQVRVSHVCQHWRLVAIETANLWTTLKFRAGCPWDENQEWLSRSKDSPLDITINYFALDEFAPHSPELEQAEADFIAILDLVLPHVSRWRAFRLDVDMYRYLALAWRRLEECPVDPGTPLLETLVLKGVLAPDVRLNNLNVRECKKRSLPFGRHMGNIKILELARFHMDWDLLIPASERSALHSTAAPYAITSLTRLHLFWHEDNFGPSCASFTNIIRCSPGLQSLEIIGSGPAALPLELSAHPMFLPKLRHLALGGLKEDHAITMLRLLYAPCLTSVKFDLVNDDYTGFVEELVERISLPGKLPEYFDLSEDQRRAFESRSKLTLVEDVNLSGLRCSFDSAYLFFVNCPNLKRLFISDTNVPGPFLTALIERDWATRFFADPETSDHPLARGLLCPQLQVLTMLGLDSGLTLVTERRKALGYPLLDANSDCCQHILREDMCWKDWWQLFVEG